MNGDERFLVEKARENLDASELLSSQGYTDIAASRAYYALFYLAEALLLQRKLAFSSHSAVIAAFGKEFSKTGELDPKFHQYLIKAQELRQTGDYANNENVSEESVAQVVAWGKEFYSATVDYLSKNG